MWYRAKSKQWLIWSANFEISGLRPKAVVFTKVYPSGINLAFCNHSDTFFQKDDVSWHVQKSNCMEIIWHPVDVVRFYIPLKPNTWVTANKNITNREAARLCKDLKYWRYVSIVTAPSCLVSLGRIFSSLKLRKWWNEITIIVQLICSTSCLFPKIKIIRKILLHYKSVKAYKLTKMETSVSEVKIDNWLSNIRLVLWEERECILSVRPREKPCWLWSRLNDRFSLRSIRFTSSSDSMAESSSSSSMSNAMKSMPDLESSWYVPWPMHSPFNKCIIIIGLLVNNKWKPHCSHFYPGVI